MQEAGHLIRNSSTQAFEALDALSVCVGLSVVLGACLCMEMSKVHVLHLPLLL